MSDDKLQKSGLMPIGRFSNACRLSIKALRHYDERGLLNPALVDPDTGYRYYRTDQSRDAVMIALLRSLEVPLDTIKHVLRAQGDELRAYLNIERKRIEVDLSRKTNALRSIERIAQSGNLTPYSIAVRSAPGFRLASIQCTTTADRMVEDSGQLMYSLFDYLGRTGTDLSDPYMCINDAPDARGNIVVRACVGVEDVESIDEHLQAVSIEGGPEAWLTHRGAYEELGLAYHALSAWVQERGYRQRNSLREIYRNDPADTSVDDLITEVIVPIQP